MTENPVGRLLQNLGAAISAYEWLDESATRAERARARKAVSISAQRLADAMEPPRG